MLTNGLCSSGVKMCVGGHAAVTEIRKSLGSDQQDLR